MREGQILQFRDCLVELETHPPALFRQDIIKPQFDTAGNKVRKVLLFPVDVNFNNLVPKMRDVGRKNEQFFRYATKRSLVNLCT